MSLFTELKRRNVFRVGIAYLLGAWVLLQAADFGLQVIDAPSWILQVLVLIAAIGLPAVLVFSWVYEMTPEGLKKESSVERDHSITGQTGKKLDHVVTSFLVLAVLILLGDRFLGTGTKPPASIVASVETESESKPAVTGKAAMRAAEPGTATGESPSVAVLPFVNMSADPENEYFSDGISEELLNLLVRIEGLRVPSRTSSFAFKGLNTDIKEIARQLEVGHVLEGSVRKAGSRVRVTAQLIDVSTDTHLWSETYDRDLEDIFAIQDEIAGHIVEALKLALAPDAAPRAPTPNLEAYNLFLQGRYLAQQRGPGLRDAEALLQRAIELDPNFAEAWGALSLTYALFPYYLGMPAEEMTPRLMETAERALALDPNLADPSLAIAKEKMRSLDWISAYSIYESVISKHPGNSLARLWFGIDLLKAGYITESAAQLAASVQLDPVSGINLDWHARVLVITGQTEAALNETRKALQFGRRQAQFAVFLLALEPGNEYVVQEMKADLPPGFEEQFGPPLRLARDPSGKAEALRAAAETDSPYLVNASKYARMHIFNATHDPEDFTDTMRDVFSFDDSISTVVWFPASSWFRSTASMKQWVAEMGLIGLWRTRGWPERCRPINDNDFECN